MQKSSSLFSLDPDHACKGSPLDVLLKTSGFSCTLSDDPQRPPSALSFSRTSTKASDDPIDYTLLPSNMPSPSSDCLLPYGVHHSSTQTASSVITGSPPSHAILSDHVNCGSTDFENASASSDCFRGYLLPSEKDDCAMICWSDLREQVLAQYTQVMGSKAEEVNVSHILQQLLHGKHLDLKSMPEKSIGAVLHDHGICKPCVFANKNNKACRNGASCFFCHHAHKEKRRRSKRTKATTTNGFSMDTLSVNPPIYPPPPLPQNDLLSQVIAPNDIGSIGLDFLNDHAKDHAGDACRFPIRPPPGLSFIPLHKRVSQAEPRLQEPVRCQLVPSPPAQIIDSSSYDECHQLSMSFLLSLFSNQGVRGSEVQSDADFSSKLLKLNTSSRSHSLGRAPWVERPQVSRVDCMKS